jgi:hypothetical protein
MGGGGVKWFTVGYRRANISPASALGCAAAAAPDTTPQRGHQPLDHIRISAIGNRTGEDWKLRDGGTAADTCATRPTNPNDIGITNRGSHPQIIVPSPLKAEY